MCLSFDANGEKGVGRGGEEERILSATEVAISLCESGGAEESKMWFRALDRFVNFWFRAEKARSSSNNGNSKRKRNEGTGDNDDDEDDDEDHDDDDNDDAMERAARAARGGVRRLLNAMAGRVPVREVTSMIFQDFSHHAFDEEFKETLLNMLTTFRIEVEMRRACDRVRTRDLFASRARDCWGGTRLEAGGEKVVVFSSSSSPAPPPRGDATNDYLARRCDGASLSSVGGRLGTPQLPHDALTERVPGRLEAQGGNAAGEGRASVDRQDVRGGGDGLLICSIMLCIFTI